jgi:enterochelin esterase-like enzyme
MRFKATLAVGIGFVASLLAGGYWYVFVAGAPQLDAQEITKSKDLSFELKTFNSQAMGQSRDYSVILPPSYNHQANRHYPVIFLLHGGHDNARAYYDKYSITKVLDQLYKENKLPESIIVMPDGNDVRGSSPLWDPNYFDGPNGKVGALIGSELVRQVKKIYRTQDAPQFWAIGGISSGGWGAVNIGLHHLKNFNVLFSHGGYFVDSSGPANSPNIFINKVPVEQLIKLHIYLDAGKSDPEFLDSSRQFHQTLNKLGVKNEFNVFPGGHGLTGADFGWNYFRKHLHDSLSYVGDAFRQAGLNS